MTRKCWRERMLSTANYFPESCVYDRTLGSTRDVSLPRASSSPMQLTQQPCFSRKMSGEHTAVMASVAFIPHAFLGSLAEISPPESVGSTHTGEHCCISTGHTQLGTATATQTHLTPSQSTEPTFQNPAGSLKEQQWERQMNKC